MQNDTSNSLPTPFWHDRRRSQRIPFTGRLHVRDSGEWMMIQDIGEGGMLVTAQKPRWPGSLLRIRFVLPNAPRAIRATCRVANLVAVPVGVGFGLQFLKLASEAKQALQDFVESHRSGKPQYPPKLVKPPLTTYLPDISTTMDS